MKTRSFLSVALAATAMGMAFVSCSNDDDADDKKQDVAYVWGTEGSIKTCSHLLFTADGKEDAQGQVIGNGDNVAGTIFSRISPELRQKIEEADLLLAKGQGNFESMYGCGKNVYYLFLCKCDWFIKKFQAERLQGMFVNEKRVKFI